MRREDVAVWGGKALPQIVKMCEAMDGELSPLDILGCLANGSMQMFLVQKGEKILIAMLTEFVNYPQKRVLRVISIAGEKLLLTRKFIPDFENWARACGVREIETFVTDGISFWGKANEYEPLYTMMRKRL